MTGLVWSKKFKFMCFDQKTVSGKIAASHFLDEYHNGFKPFWENTKLQEAINEGRIV